MLESSTPNGFLAAYTGPARLMRSTGEEPFETVASEETVNEHQERGEVACRDDAGAACRRWNWRQGSRTALTDAFADVLSALGSQLQVMRRKLAL